MKSATILLVLAVGLVNGQLNFDGNPLTENTDYTAEESQSYQRTAKQDNTATNTTESSQNLHSSTENSSQLTGPLLIRNNSLDQKDESEKQQKTVPTARNLGISSYNQGITSGKAEVALSSFLNSKTPEESRLSLNHYLQSRDVPQNVKSTYVNQHQSTQHPSVNHQAVPSLVNQHNYLQSRETAQNVQPTYQHQLTQATPLNQQGVSSPANQQHYLQNREAAQNVQSTYQQQLTQATPINQQAVSSPVNQHLTAQLMQQRQALQVFPVNQPTYNTPANPADVRSTALNPMSTTLMQQQALQPYIPGIQARNDVYYPGWYQYQRMRRVHGKPFPYAQSRLGPGLYNGPAPPVPLKQKGPPIEVIYTKPPGFHRGPSPISNPPIPYEDASAWFPEADHPPPSKDVFYSQLYAQSYDPYYYNYIAKTGKIKPHLYGKLGKYHEEEGGGIWSELYRGFKKHGLKNIMTPTFLLGMTLPVVTLMLSALVQKRSLARSDSRELSQEDTIQEYLEQFQRAVECYERKRRKRDTKVDECAFL